MKALKEDVDRPDQLDEWLETINTRIDRLDERLEKSIQSLSGGMARLERKLDRVLALSVESRGRNRQ